MTANLTFGSRATNILLTDLRLSWVSLRHSASGQSSPRLWFNLHLCENGIVTSGTNHEILAVGF